MAKSKDNKTVMRVELIVFNYSKGFEKALPRIANVPIEVAKKGEHIVSDNNPEKEPRPLFNSKGEPRRWKESFITLEYDCKDYVLEPVLWKIVKAINFLSRFASFRRAKFGIKVVIYLRDDRPDTSISQKMIARLAQKKCYLDFALC